jgi:hypothetical protein
MNYIEKDSRPFIYNVHDDDDDDNNNLVNAYFMQYTLFSIVYSSGLS